MLGVVGCIEGTGGGMGCTRGAGEILGCTEYQRVLGVHKDGVIGCKKQQRLLRMHRARDGVQEGTQGS